MIKTDFWDEGGKHIPGGFRAQKEGLFHSPRVKHAVCEDMSALMISHELHFIYGEKGKAFFDGHGFNGADVKPSFGRDDFFFAGN